MGLIVADDPQQKNPKRRIFTAAEDRAGLSVSRMLQSPSRFTNTSPSGGRTGCTRAALHWGRLGPGGWRPHKPEDTDIRHVTTERKFRSNRCALTQMCPSAHLGDLLRRPLRSAPIVGISVVDEPVEAPDCLLYGSLNVWSVRKNNVDIFLVHPLQGCLRIVPPA